MTISELCVKRPVFAVMLIGFLLVLGIFSFRQLGVDLFPKADPAVVNVSIKLPGATAEEVVTQVLLPLEDAVSAVSGLDELDSNASEGAGSLTLNFTLERDIEGAAQDVREKVSTAMRKLPPGIDPPIITKADPDADPVFSMVVAGGGSLRQTTEIADKIIKPALETVDGVAAVNLSGGRPREIRVFADVDKLEAYDITISRLENAIQSQNIEVPGGTINRGDTQMGVRTLGRIESVDQFNDIVVANVRGSPVRLRDVGRVEDTYPEATSWNYLHGQEAVVLSLQRQSGSNTLDVIGASKAKLQQIRNTLPPGTKIEIITDNSTFIKASVASLEEHLLLGSLLASLVVMLFIGDIRSVIIASLAIPASVIATFTLLKAMNFTLNSMTLLGLTLAVGIVIDDAIVVLENIVRYVEEKGYDPRQAAIDATKEITLAVVATTLSLVIIFVPIAFTTGYARVYLNSFGWTMAFAVMVSMLVSLTLTPMLCSRWLKPSAKATEDTAEEGNAGQKKHHASKESRFYSWIDRNYGHALEWALNHRGLTIGLAIATFAMTFPLNKWVGREFVPPDDQSELRINFSPPVDTSIEGTEKIAIDLTHRVENLRGVEFAWASVSKNSSIYVRLIDASKRKFTNQDVAADIRREILALPRFSAMRPKVLLPSVLGSGDNLAPVRALIAGPNIYKVADITVRAMNELRGVRGLVDISSNINLNRPELQIKIDRQRASDLGVQVGDVAHAVRLMIAGTDQISTYKEGDEQYDVTMQLLPEQQKNPDVLSRLMIPSITTGQVRLDNIATIQRGIGPLQLDRYNRQFRVVLGSGFDASAIPYDQAVRIVRETATKMLTPGYSVRLVGTAKVLDETTQSLILAFLLATIFMYMVLAAQFESFLHPFTIMLSLPLSIPFALLTLWLTHRSLNLWSALGIFLLLGIVKKNGILQVDYTNKLRESGLPLREAIVQANHVRLRPILMTTFSIVAGLIPTATGIGAGAAQRSAIAVTIIGGQSLCLLLTLLITPVAYSLLSELAERNMFRQLNARLARVTRVFKPAS